MFVNLLQNIVSASLYSVVESIWADAFVIHITTIVNVTIRVGGSQTFRKSSRIHSLNARQGSNKFVSGIFNCEY